MNEIYKEELETLKSVYEELIYTEDSFETKISGSLSIQPKFSNLILKVGNNETIIEYLPPFLFYFEILKSHVNIDVITNWLTQTLKQKVMNELNKLKENENPIWNCIYFLETEAINLLLPNGKIEYDFNMIRLTEKLDYLIEYQTTEKHKAFINEIYECCSCCVPKRGARCIKSHCNHVFCFECANNYFEALIKQGYLELKCLKCGENMEYYEVKRILSPDTFERWDDLVMKVFCKKNCKECPRCNTVAIVGDDRLIICPTCKFTFCSDCLENYHGEDDICPPELKRRKEERERNYEMIKTALLPYPIEIQDKLFKVVEELKPDLLLTSKELSDIIKDYIPKILMEMELKKMNELRKIIVLNRLFEFKPPIAYGLIDMLKELKPDFAFSSEELEKNIEECMPTILSDLKKQNRFKKIVKSKVISCPKCYMLLEKDEGCNKLICVRCQTPFCYICGEMLDEKNPYYHFKQKCQLF